MSEAGRVSPSGDTQVTRVLAGRYRLIRLVGHGGMGSVYEAQHIHTEKMVAVKLLSPQLSKDLKLVARFRREAMAASRLEHENCVRVDDFGEDADGTFYIAMELIDGHGLADELRKSGPMSPERVARVAVQLLKALDAAHSAGVLHRDLKPQNVMIMQRPQRPDIVKVVDFGIAKITTNTPEDQGALTVPGTIFGTPEYMSPEQARGENLDQRSDIFSGAVVLWHMLLGRSPFRGTSVRETLMKVFAEDPPLPSLERPGMVSPPGFEAVLLRAMSKKREDRYPDAASFLEALRPYVTEAFPEVPRRPLAGLPVDGSPPPPTLDDIGSVTLALPESELAPLAPHAGTPAPHTPHTTLDMTLLSVAGTAPSSAVAGPTGPTLPSARAMDSAPAGGASPRIVSIEDVREQSGPAPAAADPPRPPRRRRRLSGPAVAVLVAAALATIVLIGAVVLVLWLVRTGAFDKPGIVVDRSKAAKLTNVEHSEKNDKLADEIADRPVDPAARDAAIRRGEQHFAAGDFQEAREAYEEALAADPAAAKALIGVATIAYQAKDWAGACEAFEKLIALDSKYARQFDPLYARARKLRDASP
jgi:serine/threonine protein kinase